MLTIKRYSGFSFLSLIIAVAIVGVLATVTVVVLNPAELLRESRDGARLAELFSMKKGMELAEFNATGNFGEASAVYVSIPDPSVPVGERGICDAALGLPPLAPPDHYLCANPADFRRIDGNGWIPANFSSANGVQLSVLPVDPINSPGLGLYYAYARRSGKFVFSAKLESRKYLGRLARTGGTDPIRIEVGNDETVWGKAMQLLGYWMLDEEFGAIEATDVSGNGGNGTIH